MSIFDVLFGRPLESKEEHSQKVGVLAGLPMLGLDGLASAAYGPEAALTILIPLGVAGIGYSLPIIGVIVAILAVLYFSYRQTIGAYPNGGGSYTVARANLGATAGLVAAAALMLDYILVVAVGISAGVGALVSVFPSLHGDILPICLVILVLVTVVNLRGVKESGFAFALPTYAFVASLGLVLVMGVCKALFAHGQPTPVVAPPKMEPSEVAVTLWLIMKAFASGCTAMTGVEAVSNGVTAFANPTVKNAQRTLTAIVVILSALLVGIAYLAQTYRIGAIDPLMPGYQSIVSQLTAAVAGKGVLYSVVMASTLAVLALSANTGFADFPRLCRLLAEDDYMPHAFANRGRRLVYSHGIVILAILAAVLLVAFGGITDHLIPLFAVGAFLAFTLSQFGMVRHWFRHRERNWLVSAVINGLGGLSTLVALGVVLVAKFHDGAYITCILLPTFVIAFVAVKRHYLAVRKETRLRGNLDASNIRPPLVIVPIKNLNCVTEKALRFAAAISPDFEAVHIASTHEHSDSLTHHWQDRVAVPFRKSGHPMPPLHVLSSPYRRLFNPLIGYVRDVLQENPDRIVAVIIPELVEAKWWQYFLHNQRALGLKAAMLLQGGSRLVVINVPWYLEDEVR